MRRTTAGRRGLVQLAAAAMAAAAALALGAPAALAATGGTAAVSAHAAPAAFAHAALSSTEPADGTVVSKAPQQVTASFDQPVGISASSLVVYAPSGQRADDGQTVHVTTYEIGVGLLSGLGNGTYTAVWHVISADTHPVSGAFTFSIGAPSSTQVSGAIQPASSVLVSDLFAVVRWLEYLFFALLGGGVSFLIFCWPEGGGGRGAGRLVTASSLGLLVSTLLGLLLQGPYSAGTGISQLFSGPLVRQTLTGNLGPASEVREVLALVAAGVAAFLLPRLPTSSRRQRRAGGALWAVLITGVAASWAVYDHASTGIQAPWGIPDDIVHLDAVALWVGGLAMMAGFVLRRPGAGGPPPTPAAAAAAVRAVTRFSPVALGCVAAIVASGVYQTWREVGAWAALVDTSYGRLILAKIAGLIVLIGLGYLARQFIASGQSPAALVRHREGPPEPTHSLTVPAAAGSAAALGAGVTETVTPPSPAGASGDDSASAGPGWTGDGIPGPGWAPAMRRLRRSVTAELVVAAVILALTALLVNTATGREAYAPTISTTQSFSTGGPGGTGTVHVFVEPARLGPNTIELFFTQPDGKTFVPAQVTAQLYFPARSLGPLPVSLAETAPGQYRTESATVTFTGRWTLQIIVRSDAFDETSVTIPLEIH